MKLLIFSILFNTINIRKGNPIPFLNSHTPLTFASSFSWTLTTRRRVTDRQTLNFNLSITRCHTTSLYTLYISRYLAISPSRYLAISLSRCLAISLSLCLAVSLSCCLAISLSPCMYPSIYLSVYLSKYLSIYVCNYVPVPLFALFIPLEDRPVPPASPLRSLGRIPTHVRWAFFLCTHIHTHALTRRFLH